MIFVFVFFLDLLIVLLVEVVLHDFAEDFLLLPLVLAHQQDLLVDFLLLDLRLVGVVLLELQGLQVL